jgi:predicted nucleic acid-binding protein
MENKKLFIDTNIIIDLLDKKRVSHENSKKIIQTALVEDIPLAMSDDIITTVYYLSQKLIKRDELLDFIRFLNLNFTILPFTKEIIDDAIDICQKNSSYDFEDTLQSVCAKQNNFNTIITNDKQFPKISGIKLKKTI